MPSLLPAGTKLIPYGQGRWKLCCPIHGEENPSMNLWQDGPVWLFRCHACGARGDVFALVMAMLGCGFADAARTLERAVVALPEPRRTIAARKSKRPAERKPGVLGTIVRTYAYTDEAGTLLYEVVRFEPKDFRQRRPGPQGWDWSLGETRRVLYRLPRLLSSAPEAVFVVEGEKDVHALETLGLVATTNAGGAGKWRSEYGEALRGRRVVILPDNDDPGRKHAHDVERALSAVAAGVKVLALPGLPPKGDVSDWLNSGRTIEELQQLANSKSIETLDKERT